jgi:hypothetical protein
MRKSLSRQNKRIAAFSRRVQFTSALRRVVQGDVASDLPGALIVRDEDSVFEVVYRRASEDASFFGLLEFVRFEFLSGDCIGRSLDFSSSFFEFLTPEIWSSLGRRLTLRVSARIDSKNISRIPDIFGVSQDQRLELLYRGSRDGFQSSAFHSRCNGHPTTISLILNKHGYIFGGYTPIAWSSPDASLRSFIFTLKNPHNLAPRIFKQKQAGYAIYHTNGSGPGFGGTI